MLSRKRPTKRNGFTLIELLVVIAIVGILASILFSVFAQTKGAVKRTVCISNDKQIATAMVLYEADYNDYLPMFDPSIEVNWLGNGAWDCSIDYASGQPVGTCQNRGCLEPYVRDQGLNPKDRVLDVDYNDNILANEPVYTCPTTGQWPIGNYDIFSDKWGDRISNTSEFSLPSGAVFAAEGYSPEWPGIFGTKNDGIPNDLPCGNYGQEEPYPCDGRWYGFYGLDQTPQEFADPNTGGMTRWGAPHAGGLVLDFVDGHIKYFKTGAAVSGILDKSLRYTIG